MPRPLRAVLAGTVAQVKLLIQAGALVAHRDKSGATAADVVRARLAWHHEFRASLNENAKGRQEELRRMLVTLGGEA